MVPRTSRIPAPARPAADRVGIEPRGGSVVAFQGGGRTLAGACILAYFLRASLLTRIASSHVVDMLAQAMVATLLVASAYLALAGVGRINRWGVLVIAATAASLLNCERFDFALPRWLGWVILMWAVGPVNSTRYSRQFRSHMLRIANTLFVAAMLASALWWVAGLPNLGRGDFTGVMGHSMLLAPIAAYVGVLALGRLFTGGSLGWILLYGVSTLVTLVASSRAALAALAVGSLIVLFLKLKKHLVVGAASLVAAALFVVAPETVLEFGSHVLPAGWTSGVANKSWSNSRELHWQARWDELQSNPLTGVGFASAWEGATGVDEETGGVEAGSSYLAVLSMTGCVGFAAIVALAVATAGGVISRWHAFNDRQRIEICSMAGFWFVHLGAEGYIYAVGSLLSVTFWLWMGCLSDALLSIPSPQATGRMLPPKPTTILWPGAAR